MYSMVLMAALTTGTDMPDFGRRGGCHGCFGGCYGGCYGWGGCRGGCWGGCYGGCWGGCYGGCFGGGGCYGGCFGGGGCYGGGYAWGGWGCGGYGCGGYAWGGWGGYSGGGGYVAAAPVVAYGPSAIVSNTTAASPAATSLYYNPDPDANRRANVTVHLPANAKLSVDGQVMRSTSATRHFYSPPLEADKSYHYVFKAKMDRDGKPVEATKHLDVRAGQKQEITITFPDRDQSAGRQPAPAQPPQRKDSFDKSARAGQS